MGGGDNITRDIEMYVYKFEKYVCKFALKDF